MGEAMAEVFAPARALLEVVRLAFEDGIGFGSEMADSGYATTAGGTETEANGGTRGREKSGREPQAPHPQQRPTHTGSSSRLVPGGPCTWCGVTSTPQWRRPRGTNKLLCNACGIFFTRYGKLPERTQHAYTHAGSGAARSGAARAAAATSGLSAPMPVDDGQAQASTHEHAAKLADSGGDEPHPSAPEQPHHYRPRQRSTPQASTHSTPSVAGVSPYKRKDAPQPEAELLQCLEESAGSFADDAGAPPPPPLAPVGSLPQPFLAPQSAGGLLPERRSAPAASQAGLTLTASCGDGGGTVAVGAAPAVGGNPDAKPPSTVLTVAPLDLGLTHFGVQQLGQLRGLHPAAEQLAGLPPLPTLRLADSAAPLSCSAAASSACAPPLLPAPLSLLPPDLLGRPFTLPPGLLPSSASLLDGHPAPRPLYARPPKRQERLPTGDSEDSNASTDSHAATLHAASHEDEDSGTAVLGSSITSTTGGRGRGLSCSPPSSGLAFPASAALFGRAPGMPLLQGAPPASAAVGTLALPSGPLPGAGGLGAAPVGLAAAVSDSDPGVSPRSGGGPGQERLKAGPVILLQTRRCKGPRSRASSATPSSSAQS